MLMLGRRSAVAKAWARLRRGLRSGRNVATAQLPQRARTKPARTPGSMPANTSDDLPPPEAPIIITKRCSAKRTRHLAT